MKKKVFAFILLLACMKGYAQHSINLGLSYGQRINYRRPAAFISVSGISVEYAALLFPKTDFRLSAGIEGTQPQLFDERGNYLAYDDYLVVPLRAGLQQYVYADQAFVFAETGVGIGFFPFDYTSQTDTRVGWSYALGGSYRFAFNDRKYLQTSLTFSSNPYADFKFSWITLRAAYGLKWGNKN